MLSCAVLVRICWGLVWGLPWVAWWCCYVLQPLAAVTLCCQLATLDPQELVGLRQAAYRALGWGAPEYYASTALQVGGGLTSAMSGWRAERDRK